MIQIPRRVAASAAVCLLTVLATGCGKSNSGNTSGPPPAKVPDLQAAEKAARQFEADINGDPTKLIQFIDWERLFAHCTAGVDIPEKEYENVRRGFLGKVRSGGLVTQLRKQIREGGSYTFFAGA